MIEAEVDERSTPQELPPLQRYQHLEVDTFCTGCGYNLHGQPVTRDMNLGIFVCRCPECGQHHPAGVGVTAASVWMSRAATALLALWVLIVLNAFFWICIALGAITVSHIEMVTTTKMIAPDGREVDYAEIPTAPTAGGGGASWTPVYKGTTQPAPEHRNIRTLDKVSGQDLRWRARIFTFNVILAAATALVSGALMVVFLWHWRRARYALVLLLPFVIAAGVAALFYANDMDDEYERLRGWILSRSMGYAALEAASLAIGMLLGRPAARGLLRMFVPPRPRQHFAFLWRIDGKTPPPATTT
jgi:hypothetical protein